MELAACHKEAHIYFKVKHSRWLHQWNWYSTNVAKKVCFANHHHDQLYKLFSDA